MSDENLNINKSGYKNKSLFLIGIFFIIFSLTIFVSILSYNSLDPGWGIVNGNTPENYLGIYGSTLSSFIIRELGIFSGVFLGTTIFVLGIKILKNRKLSFFLFKLLGLIFLIILSVLISEIINQSITKLYDNKFPLFNFQTKGLFLYEHILNYFEDSFELSFINTATIINIILLIRTNRIVKTPLERE